MQIIETLNEGKNKLIKSNIQDASLLSKMLMKYILKKDEIFLITNGEDELDEKKKYDFFCCIEKLIKGIPVQYITNEQEFMKLKFYVDENVLIPQPDTEILVEEIINEYKNNNVKILDLCTGSGAIGISLAKYIENSMVIATDISSKAIQIAKLNAEKNLVHKKMEFILSDMFENINNKFDVITSNPPYIKTEIIKLLDKQVQSEPILALDGGIDGLDFYKIIAKNAYKFLNDNGKLFLEIGYDQKNDVIQILKNTLEYKNITCIKDLEQNNRVVIASKK